jgi:heterotetrameric sarcosine oxidase delta subunit
MLLIACPYCGPRDEIEFRWGGDAHVARPALDATDQQWADYLFVRRNPKGPNAERWLHAAGCRQWFNLVRDSATHEITAVYKMGEPGP